MKDNGLVFEWDEQKNQANKKKHGISFETAKLVFNDSNYRVFFDKQHSFGEDRFKAIGYVNLYVLVVIYAVRKQDDLEVIRLISARLADKKEERVYHDYEIYFE